jgi:hypothetical protein
MPSTVATRVTKKTDRPASTDLGASPLRTMASTGPMAIRGMQRRPTIVPERAFSTRGACTNTMPRAMAARLPHTNPGHASRNVVEILPG